MLLIMALVLPLCSVGQSLTKQSLPDSIGEKFTFLVCGHLYGQSANSSTLPASTILANVDLLNHPDVEFICSVGDLYLNPDTDREPYQKFFLNRLSKPFFNAVGNHDVMGDFYDNDVTTSYSFLIGNTGHLILDTEKNDGSIQDDQLEILKTLLESTSKNIFIYSHRPVWADGNNRYKGVFKDNTSSSFGVNFDKEVRPLLEASDKSIYWFSGSLGGGAPASYFYDQVNGVTYIQTAIRNEKRDGILLVHCDDDNISFEPVSLTGELIKPLEEYDLQFWKEHHPKQGFNYRLSWLYFKQNITSRRFWYGAGATLIFILGGRWFLRRRNKRRTG